MKFLLISILVCLTGFATADVIVDEDFEGGVLPADWQIWEDGVAGAIEWEICYVGQYTYMPDPAHSGTHYAWHDDGVSSSPLSDSWLVTETYDLSSYNEVSLNFWRYAKYASYYNYTGFWYSTVSPPLSSADFTELFELGPDNFDEWWEFGGEVTAECAGQENVTFAWVFHGEWEQAEAIDDFFLEAGITSLEQSTWGSIKSVF